MVNRERLKRIGRRARQAARATARGAARLEDDRRVQVGVGLVVGVAAIALVLHSPGSAAEGLMSGGWPTGRRDDDDDDDPPSGDPLIVEME